MLSVFYKEKKLHCIHYSYLLLKSHLLVFSHSLCLFLAFSFRILKITAGIWQSQFPSLWPFPGFLLPWLLFALPVFVGHQYQFFHTQYCFTFRPSSFLPDSLCTSISPHILPALVLPPQGLFCLFLALTLPRSLSRVCPLPTSPSSHFPTVSHSLPLHFSSCS